MKIQTDTYRAYALPLTTAVCLHVIVLLFLLPKPATIIDKDLLPDAPQKIESYLYQPEIKQVDVAETKPIAKPETKAIVESPSPEEAKTIATNTEIKETLPLPSDVNEQRQQSMPKALTSNQESRSSSAVIQTADKPKTTFNPFKGLQEQNASKDRELSAPTNKGQYGYSVFQELPEPVPESIVRKSTEQIRRERTMIVGNETIEKRDGYCYQETDLIPITLNYCSLSENLKAFRQGFDCREWLFHCQNQ
ncbi:hypothetical protein [Thalassotalea sp. PS06]|uniref:hypothetical protein n=1 Tax=Thalassotalea sp. PS06 TaxID=2594005 RepID=UPI0011635A4B|nr:hypothetical protein [Thalassotalea sp. PS06]QDP00377.1 hypothetical protein FNC98_02825 [Thalassotalea sp. PS06]